MGHGNRQCCRPGPRRPRDRRAGEGRILPVTSDHGRETPTSRVRKIGCLSGHLAAVLRAAAAGIDAFLHVAEALAVIGAFVADLRAFATNMFVVFGADEHEMRRGPECGLDATGMLERWRLLWCG